MAERIAERSRIATGNLGQGPQAYSPGRARVEQAQVEVSPLTSALSGLLELGEGIAKRGVAASAQEEYLAGARARQLGKSYEDLETDPLTAPFVRGGYQDQDYRIDQAAFSQEMQAFIADAGKTLTPAQFTEELAKRSQPVLERLGRGGSFSNRANALAEQTAAEGALITSHSQAHKDWLIEQVGQRITVQGNQLISSYSKAKTGTGAPEAEAGRITLFYNDVLNSENLPADMRGKVATQFLQALASSDAREVVSGMRERGLLDSLSFDDRVKVDEAIRASEARTKPLDLLGDVQGAAQFELDVANGNATAEQVAAYVDVGVRSKRLTLNQAQAVWETFYKSVSDKDNVIAVTEALNRGDLATVERLGFSVPEALDLVDQQLAVSGVGPTERLLTGMRLGMQLGTVPKSVGANLGAAINAVSFNPEKANPEQLAMLSSVVDDVNLKGATNPAAAGALLGAMPEETRATMSEMISQAKLGIPPDQVIRERAARAAEFQKLPDFQKRLKGAEFEKKLTEAAASLAPTAGFFPDLGTPEPINAWNTSRATAELQAEVQNLAANRNNFGMSEDALLTLAQANVDARTIKADDAPLLTLPRGIEASRIFGTSDTDAIGKVLSEQYPAPEGYNSTFRFSPVSGEIEHLLIDANGQAIPNGIVDRAKVGKTIETQRNAAAAAGRASRFGERVEQDGVSLNIAGKNSYGVPLDVAYEWRKELLQQEGVRLQVYKDRNGLAVGVGENVTGKMKEGDTISPEEAERLFRESSDRALGQGVRLANALGVTDQRAKTALASAAFQLGESGLGQFDKMADAIQRKDFEAFVKEARDSDWYTQTPQRVDAFIRRMAPHFAGLMRDQ